MNKEKLNTILLIKSSANFNALWITSLILTIPIIALIHYPNTVFAVILVIIGFIIYYYVFRETSKQNPVLHLMVNTLEIKSTFIKYDEIDYFQFIGYEADKKMIIDSNWWTPRILLLHIKIKDGRTIWQSIPNQLGKYENVKQRIRITFQIKNVLEKKEKLR